MSAPPRRPLVIGNWKMNLSELWSGKLMDELLRDLPTDAPGETAVAPSFPSLRAVANRIAHSAVQLAAQDVHWEEKGAFTGEVSPQMLAEIGVRFVIVGHSERRALFAESDERVQHKVAAVHRHNMVPVLCVGETQQERDGGLTLAVVERQLRLGLGEFSSRDGSQLVVAYEPVWAIGTGNTASPAQVDEVHRMIREQLGGLVGTSAAARVRILYGGSVSPDNAEELFALDEVDGGLVGGASLEAAAFAAIVAAAR